MSSVTDEYVQSKDLWGKNQDAWEDINKSNLTDKELFEWQEVILGEFQEITSKESEQAEISRAVREAQLMAIVNNHKEIPHKAHREIVESILNDMFSMGPLESLWKNKEISDMQVFVPVNDPRDQIITYSSVSGRQIYKGPGFRDYSHAMTWLNRHLAQFGQHYDASKVAMDATFPGQERMNVISGVSGYSKFFHDESGIWVYKYVPCMVITMRRFTHAFSTDELTGVTDRLDESPIFPELQDVRRPYKRKPVFFKYTGKTIDPATMDYLKVMVELAKTHIIAGETGSGKTSLANALTGSIPDGTILIVLEESPEMQPQNNSHVIRIVQREGVFNLAQALKNTLRMYPDRLFVAEVRDTLAYVFLTAIQTGHSGSSTTIHANSCLDAVNVLINYAANHESHPPREMIRDIVFRQVHTIIHAKAVKKPNGIARMIDEVAQLLPDQTMHYVTKFHQVGVNKDGSVAGYFEFIGPTDEFVQEMFNAGIPIPESWGWEEGE